MKYQTKKAIRAELEAEREFSVSLESENDKLTTDNLALRQKNGELWAANVSLSRAANRALQKNRELRSQLDTAKRAFGDAFTKGILSPTGSDRPNRKKLTEQEVKDIRDAYYGGAKQKDLARNYGVNPATISRTVRGIYH